MSVRRTPMKESQIDRRIEFLIREANSEDRIRDQAITYAFRVITNYLSVGYDARSRALSEKCCYRSKKAHALYQKLDDPKRWLDEVTNEHQCPIKRAWEWMIERGDKLEVKAVRDYLRKWPVVVVTKEENKSLKHHSAIRPNQRYRDAGIEVLKRNRSGDWQPI